MTIMAPLEVSWLAPMCVPIEMQFVRQKHEMVTSWSVSIQIGQTIPRFWTSFWAQASRNGPKLFMKIFLTIFSHLGTRDQYIFALGHPTCREINNLTSDKVYFYTICFLIWRQLSKNTINHRRNKEGHLNHAMCSFSTSNNQNYTIWRHIKYISTQYVSLFDVK